MSAASTTGGRLHWLRNGLRALALTLGAGHTVGAMWLQSMNEDGIHYLDMGDAWLRGDWDVAINGIWSPLYSWILGAVIEAFQPSIRWEFPAVQLANFFIYTFALMCFEFFWRELTDRYDDPSDQGEFVRLSPAVWMTTGYSLFIWSSLNMIEIWSVTPDMLVAASVFLASGLMLRLSGPKATNATAIGLGGVLGCAYLAKAVMMPLGLACLALGLFLPARSLGRARRLALSGASFLVVAGPFLVVLSLDYGKPTFADVGRFTYLKHVNEMPYPDFLPATSRLAGTPANPPRRIFDDPPVYEFSEPVGGTYPMAYDPSYWTTGLQPTVTVTAQLRAFVTNVMGYFDLFMRTQGAFLGVALLLVATSFLTRARLRPRTPEALLFVWGLSAFALYSLVHVAPRYLAPFTVLLWAGCLAHVRVPDLPQLRRFLELGGWLLVAFVWINVAVMNLGILGGLVGFSPLSEAETAETTRAGRTVGDPPFVAEALLAHGLERGDEIGVIGHSFSAFWARLARLRIVAEIHAHHVQDFWDLDREGRAAVLRAFADAGVAAVVADRAGAPLLPGWSPVGETSYAVYSFR